jgi:L-rhamnose mutarotase
MQRMGMMIGIAPDRIAEYKALHAAVWPQVLAMLSEANVRNYSIFLREPENLLFGYWEYHGEDFEADMQRIALDPETQRWWTFCSPCQIPLESRGKGEHWAMLEHVFHMD